MADTPWTLTVVAISAAGVGAPATTTVCPMSTDDPPGADVYYPDLPPPEPEPKAPVPPPVLFAFWPIDVVTDEGEPSPGWFSPDNWAGR